ncbi:hypothetical protein BCR36DRAFT_116800 [Piromyces finnis]|uniref:RRM domain-containing protein n=1 Tax=Piromyces finnis TaxID=1754191 RepID=A0A1Y1V3X3_9FUNG|nr:hypothetical protein BCR36DRAFT_116800 [Piromyces finnis]|eukprot:ORX45367.1 hypothetical protein BCR36DRAFT_116800 [Piromyces finnis]
MNIGFQNKNKNQSIVLTNFPTNVEIKELHNKLYEFLRHFGNVIQLIYKDESDKNKSYAIVRFDNENSTNNLRFSLNLVPFLGSYLFVDKEKTIQLIMPKCEYTIVNEENNSNILEITNIPKEVGEENIKGMFERFGKIIHLDIVHTQYETVTAYAYYCNAAVAKKTKRKMNRANLVK